MQWIWLKRPVNACLSTWACVCLSLWKRKCVSAWHYHWLLMLEVTKREWSAEIGKEQGKETTKCIREKRTKGKGCETEGVTRREKKKAYDAALLFRSGIVGNVKCITICHSSCMCQSQARSNENWCHTESRFKIRWTRFWGYFEWKVALALPHVVRKRL